VADPIIILHISDLHAKVVEKSQIKMRTQAFFRDVESLTIKPDLVLVTGDIAFSGKDEEYALAHELLLEPLRTRLHVPKEHTFLIPGNHDVDRVKIDDVYEAGLFNLIDASDKAENYVAGKGDIYQRLEGYYKFINEYQNFPPHLSRTQVVKIKGIKMGVACLNSAWRCSGTTDKNNLFITSQQVLDALEEIQDTNLKLAMVHHPFDWLNPAELNETIPDLKREFSIVATGHLHEYVTVHEETTTGNCIMMSAPALSDYKYPSGYNIYSIDYDNLKFRAQYRKFIRQRKEYDANTDHSRGGEKVFSIPIGDLQLHQKGLLTRQILTTSDSISRQLQQHLSIIQKSAEPLLITPLLRKVKWKEASRKVDGIESDIASMRGPFSLVFGPSESGKTVLLEAIAVAINIASSTKEQSTLAIFVDGKKIGKSVEKFIENAIEDALPKSLGTPTPDGIVICLDNINDNTPELIKELSHIQERHENWGFVISIANELIFDSVMAEDSLKTAKYYEIGYWGPSRIKEIIKHLFSQEEIDPQAAFKFVQNSLRETDLPATPVIVMLYLLVFQMDSRLSSLNFLKLLEKFETIRLSEKRNEGAYTIYYMQRILATISVFFYVHKVNEITTIELQGIIDGYFDKVAIAVNSENYVKRLVDSGILFETNGQHGFLYFAFKDYYLAKSFEFDFMDAKTITLNLIDTVRAGDALALYAGLRRENESIIQNMMSVISNEVTVSENFTLEKLDNYVEDVFLIDLDEQKTVEETTEELSRNQLESLHNSVFEVNVGKIVTCLPTTNFPATPRRSEA